MISIKSALFALAISATFAQAQTIEYPTVANDGPANGAQWTIPHESADDAVIKASLRKFAQRVPDETTAAKATEMANATIVISVKTGPLIGMALSWASDDADTCALLKRMNSSAICVRSKQ